MTVTDDRGHHVAFYGDHECADRWCHEHDGWHPDEKEEGE